ncbi:transposase [Streptomyces luteireticuli]|uniref:helix-turn-helix domain-containing protein n=1 Tax=Streptomyces luteireticuli TaxID=173858 RepID=UPI0035589847
MRYAQRGGYSPAEQEWCERLRLRAAELFEQGESTDAIAAEVWVTLSTVRQWHRQWREGGAAALRSKGPVSRERLTPDQWECLEAELKRGPLDHGFADDQGWTLNRIKTVIGRMFHVQYTPQGVSKLLNRHGWSCQTSVLQPPEREGETVGAWPLVSAPRRTWAPTPATRRRGGTPESILRRGG